MSFSLVIQYYITHIMLADTHTTQEESVSGRFIILFVSSQLLWLWSKQVGAVLVGRTRWCKAKQFLDVLKFETWKGKDVVQHSNSCT